MNASHVREAPQAEAKPLPPRRSGTVLLFIGCGRTGSTLLGQMLNYHPRCLIANEARVLTRWVAGEATFEGLLREAARSALMQFRAGLERSERFAPSHARSQPRWRSFAELAEDPAFAKESVCVIGDKKAGGATEAVLANERAVAGLVAAYPIRLLQVVRDPVAAAASAMRAHGVPTFAAACERIVGQSAAAHRFASRFGGRSLTVAYEDLCATPRIELTRIASWLDLPAPPRWLDEMAARVDDAPPPPADPDAAAACRSIVRFHDAAALFERYESVAAAHAATA